MKSDRINKKTKSYVHKHDLFFFYIPHFSHIKNCNGLHKLRFIR